MTVSPQAKGEDTAGRAFRFVVMFGLVNLFADFTYEGARSVNGAFLGALGASAAATGLIAGLGELVGYGLRLLAGIFADRTRCYWTQLAVGYVINLLAVPALALAGSWPVAAALIVAERAGRAVRKPPVEAFLSQAGQSIGQGWVFGLNEALDQAGATFGPLLVAWILYRHGGYQHAFAALLVSALLCLATLACAAAAFRSRTEPHRKPARGIFAQQFPKAYWWLFAAGILIAAGYADFALIAFHFQHTGIVPVGFIPALYAIAMATGAIASPVLGSLLDRWGRPVLAAAFVLPILFAPLVFLGGYGAAIVGMVLWGLGMAGQDTLLKALVARNAPPGGRATTFGLFDTGFGLAWFLGSAAIGWLYGRSIPAAVIFSTVLQAAAVPVLLIATRQPALE